jgi:hypothetical protein
MINKLPFIGWVISLTVSISLSIPFWFIWNRLAAIYFYWLPQVYLHIPFWHCVGLFIILPILKGTLIPTLIDVKSTSESR